MYSLIKSVSNVMYKERMDNIFDLVFKNYKYSNSYFISNKLLFMSRVVYEFVSLIMKSDGEFQIITDRFYIFKNKQFFVSVYHLFDFEIKNNIVLLIDSLELTNTCNQLKLFETKPILYNVPLQLRLNLLYGFLRYIAQTIADFQKSDSIIKLQHKIRLCKKFIGICTVLENHYNLDLSRNKSQFKGIITRIQTISSSLCW